MYTHQHAAHNAFSLISSYNALWRHHILVFVPLCVCLLEIMNHARHPMKYNLQNRSGDNSARISHRNNTQTLKLYKRSSTDRKGIVADTIKERYETSNLTKESQFISLTRWRHFLSEFTLARLFATHRSHATQTFHSEIGDLDKKLWSARLLSGTCLWRSFSGLWNKTEAAGTTTKLLLRGWGHGKLWVQRH